MRLTVDLHSFVLGLRFALPVEIWRIARRTIYFWQSGKAEVYDFKVA
jgi:hypothetical protein